MSYSIRNDKDVLTEDVLRLEKACELLQDVMFVDEGAIAEAVDIVNTLLVEIDELKVLEKLFAEHQKFAAIRFPESTWQSSLRGLEREIKEVELAKFDYSVIDGHENRKLLGFEYMDCFKYLLDSMKRNGFDASEIKDLFAEKMAINKERTWAKNKDDSYSHVKK